VTYQAAAGAARLRFSAAARASVAVDCPAAARLAFDARAFGGARGAVIARASASLRFDARARQAARYTALSAAPVVFNVPAGA
jgi:hypothetical protein